MNDKNTDSEFQEIAAKDHAKISQATTKVSKSQHKFNISAASTNQKHTTH